MIIIDDSASPTDFLPELAVMCSRKVVRVRAGQRIRAIIALVGLSGRVCYSD